MMEINLFELLLPCNRTQELVKNDIFCLVIQTKVDTSQVPQQM